MSLREYFQQMLHKLLNLSAYVDFIVLFNSERFVYVVFVTSITIISKIDIKVFFKVRSVLVFCCC